MSRICMLIIAGLLGVAGVVGVAQVRAEVALRAAREIETVKGDLKGAIAAYGRIADDKSADRAVRAEALVRMADCYQKLGDAEAKAVYERIIREFGDQKDAVSHARTRMAGSGAKGGVWNRLLWTLPHSWVTGAVSRDGRFVPFIPSTTSDDLFVRDVITGADRLVVKAESDNVYPGEAAISRDGRQIVFAWANDDAATQELRLAPLSPASAALPRRLFAQASARWMQPFDWSPDGKFIAIAIGYKDSGAELAVISAADGSKRTLKSGEGIFPRTMAFSSDGRYVAADRQQPTGAHDIYVMTANGEREIPAVVHRADDRLVGWAPDGRLVFTSDRNGTNSLWTARLEGDTVGDLQLLKSDVGQLEPYGVASSGAIYSVSYSPPVAFDVLMGTLDPSAGGWSVAPTNAISDHVFGRVQNPRWSPDGKAFAYVVTEHALRAGAWRLAIQPLAAGEVIELPTRFRLFPSLTWMRSEGGLFVGGVDIASESGVFQFDAATRARRIVRLSKRGETLPTVVGWSKEGAKVFVRVSVANGKQVSVIERDMNDGTEREVFRGDNSGRPLDQLNADPALSADGRKLYYRRPTGEGQPPFREVAFLERDLLTGADREVTRGALGYPWISPDGRYIATASNDASTKTRVLVLIPVDGGPPVERLRVPLVSEAPGGPGPGILGWLPDSRAYFAHSVQKGKPELWLVPVDPQQQPKRIAENWRGESLQIHPDGKRVLFQVRDTQPRKPPQLSVLENVLTPAK